MIKNNTRENQQDYLQQALSDSEAKPSYISLFYDEEKLIAFLTFELFEVDETTIFHAKLAANLNEDNYKSQQLISIALRPMAAIKILAPNKNLVVYGKAIFPGLGLSAVLPEFHTEFYPKFQHELSDSFVKKIVEMTGEVMEEGKIAAKLKLHSQNSRPLDLMNPVINYFFDEIGKDDKNAMAFCYKLTNDVLIKYLASVANHNIDAITIKDFASTWELFNRMVLLESCTLKAKL